jgi:ferredoxin
MVKLKNKVDEQLCLACGGCISICPQDAISMCGNRAFIFMKKCISCGLCVKTCPVGAIFEVK